jgi:hypothetical protein
MTRILGSCRSAIMASHRVRRPGLCRRHPRPPCTQRPSHRSRRRKSETPPLQIDAKGLITSPQLCQKSTASKAPASQATSSRIAGRHHLGISGRLRRNPQGFEATLVFLRFRRCEATLKPDRSRPKMRSCGHRAAPAAS